jgi:Putative phage tail protein
MSNLLSGAFGSKKQTQAPSSSLRVSTALQGIPIPFILAGKNRLPCNCIWSGNFNYQTPQSGGKGGALSGGGKGSGGNNAYYVDALFAICEGPIAAFVSYFANGVYTLIESLPSDGTLFLGSYTQDIWPYLEAAYPTQALAYRGIAAAGFEQMDLGSSPTLPQLNWEVLSVNNTAIPGQPDGDPKDAWLTFLSNAFFGVGFPTNRLDQQLTQFSSYCRALGLVVSPVLASATQASSFLSGLLTACNADAAWYDGFLTIIPRGDQAVTAGSIQSITETHAVPTAGTAPVSNPPPYPVILPGFLGGFIADQGVKYQSSGIPLTYTPEYPPTAPGFYTILAPGWYVFNDADTGQSVAISYEYAAQASYTPNNTPLWDFTVDDYLPNQGTIGQGVGIGNQNAIIVVRKSRDQMLNSLKLTYYDRSNQYNPVTIEIKDEASIVTYGRYRPSDIQDSPFFCLASAAQQSAMLQLIRQQIPLTYQWTAGKAFILCTVGQLVTLTGPAGDGRQLYRQIVKITEVQENTDSTLTFTAEFFPGTAAAPEFGVQAALGLPLNFNAAPGNVNQPILFEPTDLLGNALISGGGLMVAAAVSGQDPAIWGGCKVYISYDNATYNYLTTINGPARMGVTTADFPTESVNPIGQTIDQTNTLAVDLTESDGTLISATVLDALALNTRCYVGPINGGGEIVAFETATLTATNKYNLTYLVRGGYGTEAEVVDHPAGSSFCRIDDQVVTIPYDQSRIGATIYLKFCSYNSFQGGQQTLDEVAAFAYVLQGTALSSPLPNVANLRTVFNVNTGFEQLVWDNISDFRTVQYRVRVGASPEAALTLSTDAQSPFTVPGNGLYWVDGFAQPAPGLEVYSETPQSVTIAGAVITQNVMLTIDLAAEGWPGTFSGEIGVDTTLNALRTSGSGNILSDTSILTTPDILNYGGEGTGGGTYYPSGTLLNIGYVAPVSVSIKYQPTGSPVGQNILTIPNILVTPDILGAASTQYVTGYPLIETATTETGMTPNWAPWEKFAPGTKQAQWLNFGFYLATIDPNTVGYNLAMAITATIPARIDQYPVTSSASVATTITFQPQGATSPGAFNGGAAPGDLPAISWGITNAQAGDDLIVSALSLSSVTFAVWNSGVMVSRTLTLFAEGF